MKRAPPSRPTKKTKYSFLRWLHKRNALLEQTAASNKEKDVQPLLEPLLEPLSEELMSWADDGGSAEQETPTD